MGLAGFLTWQVHFWRASSWLAWQVEFIMCSCSGLADFLTSSWPVCSWRLWVGCHQVPFFAWSLWGWRASGLYVQTRLLLFRMISFNPTSLNQIPDARTFCRDRQLVFSFCSHWTRALRRARLLPARHSDYLRRWLSDRLYVQIYCIFCQIEAVGSQIVFETEWQMISAKILARKNAR